MVKPPLVVVAAVIERDGTFLVARRQAGVPLEGYWEFPGGKRHPGEGEVDALRREIREELNAEVQDIDQLMTVTHEYDDRVVELHFYRCALVGSPTAMLGQELKWTPKEELARLLFPPADAELIARLVTPNGP